MRKSRGIVIVMLLTVLFTFINLDSIIYANQKIIVPSAIRYSGNNKKAEILFNVEGVDTEAYELITIVSDSDGEVVYDGTQDSEEIAYIVSENDDYSFTVTYVEKQIEEIGTKEEKTTVITASVTEIINTEKTDTIEENDTEEIDIDEEVSIATLNDSVSITSNSTIKLNKDYFPDAALRQWIKDTFGFQEGDELTDTEIEQAVVDNLYNNSTQTIRAIINNSSSSTYANIENIEGLQYFTNIQEIVLSYTQVTNISYVNLPESIESLTINRSSDLTKIDLSGCNNLHTLTALYDSNLNGLELPIQITTLALTGAGLLGEWNFNKYTSLTFLQIDYTNITSLDVTECSSLVTLYAWYNSNLTNLTLPSSSSVLTSAYLGSTGLSGEWNFSEYTSLKNLYIADTSITGIDVSGCTSLTDLNVSNNPLVYLNLSSNYVGSFQANSLKITIDKLTAKVDDTGIYIELEDLFKEIGIEKVAINQIIEKMSNVNVTDGIYNSSSTNKIYGIENGATISYTYDTGNTKTISPNITITTIDNNDLLPKVEGVDADFGVNDTIASKDKLQQYGRAERYDDFLGPYILSEIEGYGLKIVKEEYFYFNYSTNRFEEIEKDGLLTFSRGIGIYAYQFTVQDARDSRLTSTGVSRFFVGGECSYIERNDDKSYVLVYDIESLSIKETEMAAEYYNQSLFKEYIESQFSCQGYLDNGELSIEVASTEYNYSNFGLSNSLPTALIPGSYELSVNVDNGEGVSIITKEFYITITENPYSYNEDNVSTDNGASGYLIIPKYIELKSDTGNTVSAEVEVNFANYEYAIGVTYGLCVDRVFKIVNTSNKQDTITVTTSSAEIDAKDDGDKLDLGDFTTSNMNNGKKITFTASKTGVAIDSRWVGSVTFYFTRKSGSN